MKLEAVVGSKSEPWTPEASIDPITGEALEPKTLYFIFLKNATEKSMLKCSVSKEFYDAIKAGDTIQFIANVFIKTYQGKQSVKCNAVGMPEISSRPTSALPF